MRASVLFLLLAACSSNKITTVPCVTDPDCAPNELCSLGRCEERPPGRDGGTEGQDAGGGKDTSCSNPTITASDKSSWCTIQHAIDGVSQGATITIPSGRFLESLVVDKFVVIRGQGANDPGSTTLVATATGAAIAIRAQNVNLGALAIEAHQGRGIDISARATVKDVAIRGAGDSGIRVENGGIAVFEDIALSGVASTSTAGVGVRLLEGAMASITASKIDGAAAQGILCQGAMLDVRSTEIVNSGSTGLYIERGSMVTFEAGSRVSLSGSVGIIVNGSAFSMKDSESSGNGPVTSNVEDGLWLMSPTQAIVDRSTFANNRGYGIHCGSGVVPADCTGNTISNNNLGPTNCMGCN